MVDLLRRIALLSIAWNYITYVGFVYGQQEVDRVHEQLEMKYDFQSFAPNPQPFFFYERERKIDEPEFVDLYTARHLPVFMSRRTDRPTNVGPTVIVTGPQIYNMTNGAYPVGLLGRSETALAASTDGKYIVVAWNDPTGFMPQYTSWGLSGHAFSNDGGESFISGGPLPPGDLDGSKIIPRGDPWLDVAGTRQDTFYLANLAAREGNLSIAGIVVHRGIIQGDRISWNTPSLIRGPGEFDILDKEVIAADKRPGSRSVYVATTNFVGTIGTRTQIEIYHSTDAGEQWVGPLVVNPNDPSGQQGADMVVGPDGEVYVTWERGVRYADSAQIIFRSSFNDGQTFDSLRVIASIKPTAAYPPVGYARTRSGDFPRIAIDLSDRFHGRIYIVYQDAGNNEMLHTDGLLVNKRTGEERSTGGVRGGRIYLKYSDDRGESWSAPVPVSGALRADRRNQFWPVVSVMPNGLVNIVYHEDTEMQSSPFDSLATNISLGNGWRRQSSYQSLVDVMWTQSRDGGKTFQEPVPLNETAANWSASAYNIIPNFGDYIASASVSGRMYTCWAHSVLYDIDPGPNTSSRFVPSVAFAVADFTGKKIAVKPQAYALRQNFPNPFNPITEIRFDLAQASDVDLTVYNLLGQKVATLVSEYRQAGQYIEHFSGKDLPSGFYFYKLIAGEYSSFKKMALIR